jgi:hypothetical protein
MNKNYKIAIALLGLAGIFLAYKKGLFTKKVSEEAGESNSTTSESGLPIVNLSPNSETAQVVDTQLPPQFTENVATANVKSIPGSFQSYAS